MGDAKIPELYAVLGITSRRASQNEIQVAYEELVLKFDSERRLGHVQPNAVELIKIQRSYNILGDPEQRAEYEQKRARGSHRMRRTPEGASKPGQKAPLDEPFPVQLRICKRAWVRPTPPRAQLRVQAQLRAHVHRLAQIKQQVQVQGLRKAGRQVEVESNDEFEQVWALVSQIFEPLETVNEDSTPQEEERKEALIRQAAQEAKLREEKAACEREEAAAAAAAQRAEEIEWINQEAKESILILAGMGERPTRPLGSGYAQMVREDYVRRLVDKTDDLLDYLWDKAHSGDWICSEIQDGVDLDRLVGFVLHSEPQRSYFPSATQDLAASLLRKWRAEDCNGTDDGTPPVQEAASQSPSESESSDGDSSTESEVEGELPSTGLQFYSQAAEPQHSPFAQNTTQSSPFAQNIQQSSKFSKSPQQKSPFALGHQQYNIGAEMSFGGWKRMRSPDEGEGQENQGSKRQRHVDGV